METGTGDRHIRAPCVSSIRTFAWITTHDQRLRYKHSLAGNVIYANPTFGQHRAVAFLIRCLPVCDDHTRGRWRSIYEGIELPCRGATQEHVDQRGRNHGAGHVHCPTPPSSAVHNERAAVASRY